MRIVCVDDDLLLGRTLVRFLSDAGHRVHHARNGQAAWERLVQDFGAVDLVITEHEMPEMNGLELVQQLRASGFPGKVIVFSGALTDDDIADYQELSVTAIVPKITGSRHLLHVIESLFL